MGIRGLTKFIHQNPEFCDEFLLYNTKVIIDGNNLTSMLYLSENLDCIYGGDFSRFAVAIKEYFALYQKCNIEPIMVFDGGMDKSDRKLYTTLRRYEERLKKTRDVAFNNTANHNILPNNTHSLFRDILSEMKITIVQCDFECDDQLPALASYYKCPVLSRDSDFYLFDMPHGFIHLELIETSITKLSPTQCALKCKIYHLNKFLSFFPGIEKNTLPLFGALMGNDYVDASAFENFFIKVIKSSETYKSYQNCSFRERQLKGILQWLRYKTLDEAQSLIQNYVTEDQKKQTNEAIKHTIDSFMIKNCNLTFMIDNKVIEETIRTTKLIRLCGRPLSSWFIRKFNTCVFPPLFCNVMFLNRVFLQPQVEDIEQSSTFVCSRYIRQVLYGILLRHRDNSLAQCKNEVCIQYVEEYDRNCWEKVESILHTRYGTVLPMLEEIEDSDQKHLKEILKEALNEKSDCFSSVPSFWMLLVASIRYWLRNCEPKPYEDFINALIVNIIYLWLHNNKTKKHNKISTRNMDMENFHILKNLSSEDKAEKVLDYLDNKFRNPVADNEKLLTVDIIHNFNQLQTCIIYIKFLNKLLNSPFVSTEIHNSADGTIVYNLTREIRLDPLSPDVFVYNLLWGEQTSLYKLFKNLKGIILQDECGNCVQAAKGTIKFPNWKRNYSFNAQRN